MIQQHQMSIDHGTCPFSANKKHPGTFCQWWQKLGEKWLVTGCQWQAVTGTMEISWEVINLPGGKLKPSIPWWLVGLNRSLPPRHPNTSSGLVFFLYILGIQIPSKQVAFCWSLHTVDGRNPAPVDMVNSPLFAGFCKPPVVQDFSHRQYLGFL